MYKSAEESKPLKSHKNTVFYCVLLPFSHATWSQNWLRMVPSWLQDEPTLCKMVPRRCKMVTSWRKIAQDCIKMCSGRESPCSAGPTWPGKGPEFGRGNPRKKPKGAILRPFAGQDGTRLSQTGTEMGPKCFQTAPGRPLRVAKSVPER